MFDDKQAFYAYVAKDTAFVERLLAAGVEKDGCILRTKCINTAGYAQVYYKGMMFLAHRVVAIAHGKAFPSDRAVMHSCDIPNCINPAHLLGGTMRDNTRDMDKKDRRVSGDRSHLTDTNRHPRNASVMDPLGVIYVSAASAAREYGYSRAHVSHLASKALHGWKKL